MMIRLANAARPAEITLTIDGARITAPAGEMLATALAVTGRLQLRRSPRAGAPRGAFCFMGACQECAIMVDGQLRQACMTPVRDGMIVSSGGVP